MNKRLATAEEFLKKCRYWTWNVFSVFVIIMGFFFLMYLFDDLDGLNTFWGSVVGALLFVLWFTPVVDKLILGATRLAKQPWFRVVMEAIRFGRLAVAMVIAAAAAVVLL
jgi:hypothetical protein